MKKELELEILKSYDNLKKKLDEFDQIYKTFIKLNDKKISISGLRRSRVITIKLDRILKEYRIESKNLAKAMHKYGEEMRKTEVIGENKNDKSIIV